jgi:hypothetical protein
MHAKPRSREIGQNKADIAPVVQLDRTLDSGSKG